MPRRVMLIEDDPQIGRLVTSQLREAGFEVDWVPDGAAGLARFLDAPCDLLIIDLMLPSMDGLEICRRIRADNRYTPILMLTAKSSLRDVVLGLELGADEYVIKPFASAELMARIRAIFRRLEADREQIGGVQPSRRLLHRGALSIDADKHLVTLHGKPVTLTAKEFALLLLFAGHPGHAFSRSELLDRIWGPEFDGFDHTVNTHINRLRRKIETDPSRPRFICTVWGVGYRFAEIDEVQE